MFLRRLNVENECCFPVSGYRLSYAVTKQFENWADYMDILPIIVTPMGHIIYINRNMSFSKVSNIRK